MNSNIRSVMALAVVVLLASLTGFAQSSGEAIYKAKCMNCHGPTGRANSGIGSLMKVKPVTDPSVQKMNEAEMIEVTRKGMGRMQGFKGELTDAQIKGSVAYFRTFIK
jgi:mono/diheme cytochrome c family protein